jgi:hypothetical protein
MPIIAIYFVNMTQSSGNGNKHPYIRKGVLRNRIFNFNLFHLQLLLQPILQAETEHIICIATGLVLCAFRIINFWIWDGVNSYCLSLNTKEFTWKLGIAEESSFPDPSVTSTWRFHRDEG